MKKIARYLLPLMLLFSLVLSACGGAATQAPAATEPAATDPVATEPSEATEAPAEEPGATEAPAGGTAECPAGVEPIHRPGRR